MPAAPQKDAKEEQQKFIKTGKVVIVLQGRYAGRKAVVVKSFDEGTKERPYPHAIVAGVATYPRKIKKSLTEQQLAYRSRVKPFLKIFNYAHLMPTRYGVDLDLKNYSNHKVVSDPSARANAKKEIKDLLQQRYLSGKNKWFFTKLKF